MDIPTSIVPLDKFIQEQDHYVQDQLGFLSRMLINEAERILKETPFCFKPNTAKQVAEGVVLKGEVIMTNSDPENADDDDEAELINDIGDEYALALKVAFLPIQAPVEKDGNTLECDTTSREMQLDNFMKLHPDLRQENLKVQKSSTVVAHDYATMKKAVDTFVSEYGTRAVVVSIAFNGHGNANGACFHNQEVVKLDTIITDMQEVLKKHRSNRGLPCQIELIFSQCFGHVHGEPESPDLVVYHFTSDKCKRTYVRVSRDPFTQDMVDAHHMELEGHVEQSQRGWIDAQALVAEKRRAVQDDDGPCTSIGAVGVEAAEDFDVEGLE